MCLQDFALTAPGKCPEPVESLARDTLALLKRRPEPDVAVAVLTEAGLLRLHEPVPLLRLGRSTESEFEPYMEQAAKVGRPPHVGISCTSLVLGSSYIWCRTVSLQQSSLCSSSSEVHAVAMPLRIQRISTGTNE